jgi:sulfatase modifying factor 1
VHSPEPAVDPQGPAAGDNKVKKGGSYMCNVFTCYRYRVSARMPLTPESSAGNVGFRCAASVVPQGSP